MPATASAPAATTGGERARREVALEVGVAGAARVAHEEHGGEVGAGGDEQHARSSARAGFSQLVTGSPVALPTGTRPDAIAPTTVPMKNGVSSDERPKSRVASARPCSRRAVCWKAKPEPRRTIPSAARLSGMNRVEKIDLERVRERRPEHDEDEDQPDVVGLPDRPDRPVDQLAGPPAALAAPATSAQKPAPKSAPAKTA